MTINKQWKLLSQFGEEKKLINDIRQIISTSDVYYERVEDIMTAVAEACLNAFEHGNKLRADLQICVQMMSDEHGLCFRIYDEGNGFDYTNTSRRPVHSASLSDTSDRGWGMLIITNLADSINTGHKDNMFYFELQFFKNGGKISRAGK